MLKEHQAFDVAMAIEYLRHAPGQRETGNRVWDVCHSAAVYVACNALAIGLIGQREHGSRMGMVDKFVRQERMQQSFYGGIWRAGIEEIDALVVHHLFVRQALERAQAAKRCETDRGQAGGLDIAHVPAGAFDADDLELVTEEIVQLRFHRRIAAAVEDEARIGAEQTRRVDAQREILADALSRVTGHKIPRFGIRPTALHSLSGSSVPHSGNNDRRPSRDAAQVPRSVTRPVTSRAGVTSKPGLAASLPGAPIPTVANPPRSSLPVTFNSSSGERCSIGMSRPPPMLQSIVEPGKCDVER